MLARTAVEVSWQAGNFLMPRQPYAIGTPPGERRRNMKDLLAGKRGLILGLANNRSIAWGVARAIVERGGEVAFTYQGDALRRRVEPLAAELGGHVVGHCDVTDEVTVDAAFTALAERWPTIDFLVHAVAFSDKDQLTGRYIDTTADNFTNTLLISCYSLTTLARRAEPMLRDGGSILTLTYYGAEKVMPHYNVMGVAKAALEASVRYLAVDLGGRGIRVNAISAGPIKTLAASGIGDFRYILKWNEYNAPLKRTVTTEEVGGSAAYPPVRSLPRRDRRGPSRRFRLPRGRHEGGGRPRHLDSRLTTPAARPPNHPGSSRPMATTPTLVFLRHGETDWNRESRLQGQKDIPLNDLGRRQARRNGEVARTAVPGVETFDFVASPLVRCRETMEIAREAMGLPRDGYRTDDRLKEITFGQWEGWTTEEMWRRDPAAMAARDADKWRFAPPGGESYAELKERIDPWVEELARPTFVVSHGGIGRVLRIRFMGEEPLTAVSVNVAQDRVFVLQDGIVRLV